MSEYKTIVIDPPWFERGGGKSKRGADRHYQLLSTPAVIEAILRSPLWSPARNSHLWLWATCNHLPDALDVMRALGYKYKTHMAWLKARYEADVNGRPWWWSLGRPGLGQYLRGVHELCLFGVRGRLAGNSKKVPSACIAERRAHSQKPEEAFRMIEEVSPAPRAELFARGPRDGWTCWGMDGSGAIQLWTAGGGPTIEGGEDK